MQQIVGSKNKTFLPSFVFFCVNVISDCVCLSFLFWLCLSVCFCSYVLHPFVCFLLVCLSVCVPHLTSNFIFLPHREQSSLNMSSLRLNWAPRRRWDSMSPPATQLLIPTSMSTLMHSSGVIWRNSSSPYLSVEPGRQCGARRCILVLIWELYQWHAQRICMLLKCIIIWLHAFLVFSDQSTLSLIGIYENCSQIMLGISRIWES